MTRSPIPLLTVCVPLYEAADLVADTLASIKAQTFDRLIVRIADDASTDGSVEACRPFLDDPRFELEVRTERLGWVENTNALLFAATSPFVTVTPHDDVLLPTYYEQLVEEVERTQCAMAFADVEVFGLLEKVELQPSVLGSPFERLLAFLDEHNDGNAYRGVIRTEALRRAGGLCANADDDFAADVEWLARLAAVGELRRVPDALYRKRRRPGSASLRWGDWDPRRRVEAWGRHCAAVLAVADGLDLTDVERDRLRAAAARRVTWLESTVPGASLHRAAATAAFTEALALSSSASPTAG